ncbi:MAG: zf-TFIIB domain-containing protein [Acidobacteriota bacterium]
MQIETLNCPNCGAALTSDSPQCEFCRSRLKTMACPKCFGLMFLGSQFCGHCGAKTVRPEIVTDEKAGKCPRCKVHLSLLEVTETTLRECEQCGGLWADVETFETVCADNEKQALVLTFLGENKRVDVPPAKINYVPCPDCNRLMNRSNFARSSGVVIDVCKSHGAWFDADELPKIIEFIRKGGMERYRQRELNEIKEERAKLNNDLGRTSELNDHRLDLSRMQNRDESEGILTFVRQLFE